MKTILLVFLESPKWKSIKLYIKIVCRQNISKIISLNKKIHLKSAKEGIKLIKKNIVPLDKEKNK